MDDEALVARLRQGDEAAYTLLVHRHGPYLLNLAQAVLHRRVLAEEAVQDTWLAVYEGISRFEGRSSLRTWVTHILLNRARSAAVRERRATPVESRALDALPDPSMPISDTVDDRVCAEQLVRTVHRVLPQLPPAQRRVVTMLDLQHFSPAEVRNELGVTLANQRVLLHRAHARLRRHLEPEINPR